MANSSPMYPNDARTSTQPWSIGGPGLVRAFEDQGGEHDQQAPRAEEVHVEHRHAEERRAHVEEREEREVEQQAAEHEQPDQPLRLARRAAHSGSLSCSRMAGFSSVDTSCVIASPLAIERSRRRMILPERVLGRLSPNRMSFGLAIGPISFATQSRSSLAIFCASSPE